MHPIIKEFLPVAISAETSSSSAARVERLVARQWRISGLVHALLPWGEHISV
jgi:hypothetical protein